jgi:DNA polymerase III subunit beta
MAKPMKFKIETKLLKEALNVISVVAAHATLPILGNVRIEAGKNGIILSVTNLDLYLTYKVPAEIKEPGAITTPLSLLGRLVNAMTSSMIEISLNGTGLDFVCGETKAFLEILPSEEFPPEFEQPAEEGTFDAKAILEPFTKLAHAMCTDASRYNLMGIGISSNSNGCDFAATSGARLAIFHGEKISTEDVIVPDIFVRALLKINPEGQLSISVSKSVITVANNEIKLSGKMIEAKYPNWKQVVPKNGSNVFSGDRCELMSAIKVCCIFSSDKIQALTMKGQNKEIEISKPGRSRVTVLGAELGGQPKLEIKFNAKFVLDALSVLEQDVVRIRCSDEKSPMLIQEGAFQSVVTALQPV